jgi:TraM recognition site of TraD and TraG
VFQDMAQIYAVYGRDQAPTIVSNHRAKVILSGVSDPQTLEHISRLLGDEQVPLNLLDLERPPPFHYGVIQFPAPRASERPARDEAPAGLDRGTGCARMGL